MRALIDADILLYKAGFASQKVVYTIDQEDIQIETDSKRIANDYSNVKQHFKVVSRNGAQEIMCKMIDDIIEETKASTIELFITDSKSNFRLDLSDLYKANRTESKPFYYDFLREYLIKTFKAVVVRGQEADDELGIRQTDDTIICSIDKDLLMIPGKHYNIDNRTIVQVDELGGFYHFCRQVLTGDSVDNIRGLDRVGPKRADNILLDCHDYRSMWEAVKKAYEDADRDDLMTVAQLIWIRRKREQHPMDYIGEVCYADCEIS